MARVKVTISPMADVKMEVEGVQGQSCVDLTKALEKSIGADPGSVDRQLKPEYRATGGVEQKQTARW